MKLRGFEKITSFKEVEFPMPERKNKNGGRLRYLPAAGRYH